MGASLEPDKNRLEILGSGLLDYIVIGITRLFSREMVRNYCEKSTGRLDKAHFMGAYEAFETISHGNRLFIRCRRVGPPGLTQLVLVELIAFDPWIYMREEKSEEATGWRLVAEPGYMPALLHVTIGSEKRSYKLGYDNLLPLSRMGMSKLIDRSAAKAASVLEDHGYVVAGYATDRLGLIENLVLVADKEDFSESVRVLITSHFSNIYWFSRDGLSAIRSTETKPEKLAKELKQLFSRGAGFEASMAELGTISRGDYLEQQGIGVEQAP